MRIFGIAGFKNSGKTTLVVELIQKLTGRGLKIATVKHAHHEFDIDHPGKDSYLHREAGAVEVIVASSRRWAHIRELENMPEPALADLLAHFGAVDLVLIEGYKREDLAKLEVRRGDPDTPILAATDRSVRAIVADTSMPDAPVQVLSRADLDKIADFVEANAQEYPGG